MHWKLKALAQNAISLMPSSASYAIYYFVQRRLGGLRRMDPVSRLKAGIETWRRIARMGRDPKGKVFLEIGTGHVPLVPMAYWLMGAHRVITIDQNPYLKAELLWETLQYFVDHQDEVRKLFGALLDESRLEDLLRIQGRGQLAIRDFLALCCIDYIAPGDAAQTSLAAGSVDFHTSYAVFEHIPVEVLRAILAEGNRLIANDGLFVHRIDYSDHFSHSDRTISAINFLKYSEAQWHRYAGNRYMYMNRLRHDDFLELFEAVGHRILEVDPEVDVQSRELILNGRLHLHGLFREKSVDALSTIRAWIISNHLA